MGWGGFLDKLLDKLPIQSRVERWKNQIDTYEREKKALLKGDWDVKKANRLLYINTELVKLRELIKNKAQD